MPIDPVNAGDTHDDHAAMVVAVTGHRDLVDTELPLIRSRVRAFLQQLREEVPERRVSVMSALAEGADQLAADIALELRLPLIAVLPMPRASYESDFATASSRQRFVQTCAAATEVIELPLVPGNTVDTIAAQGEARTRQYAELGQYLCIHGDVLLALWDGKANDLPGGTAWVLRWRLEGGRGPAYHVVCSRARADGAPAPGLETADTFWHQKN